MAVKYGGKIIHFDWGTDGTAARHEDCTGQCSVRRYGVRIYNGITEDRCTKREVWKYAHIFLKIMISDGLRTRNITTPIYLVNLVKVDQGRKRRMATTLLKQGSRVYIGYISRLYIKCFL